MSKTVQLRCATLPFIGAVAEHYWFVVFDEATGACRRWEVWQSPDAGGQSYGHLHCDMKPPDAGVGGGPARIVFEWKEEDALKIDAVISSSETHYPYRNHYWP